MQVYHVSKDYQNPPLLTHHYRDDVLQLAISQFTEQGTSACFETACRLVDPMRRLSAVFHQDYFKLWEIYAHFQLLAPTGAFSALHFSSEAFRTATTHWFPDLVAGAPVGIATLTVLNNVWPMLENILAVLQPAGYLVLQLGYMNQFELKLLLWFLFNIFEEVHLCKPRASPVCDQEKFIVCRQFRATQYGTVYAAQMQSFAANPMAILEQSPLQWFAHVHALEIKFAKHEERWKHKAVAVAKLLGSQTHPMRPAALRELEQTCFRDAGGRRLCERYLAQNKINTRLLATAAAGRSPPEPALALELNQPAAHFPAAVLETGHR